MPLMNDRNDELDPEAIEDDPGAEATGTPEPAEAPEERPEAAELPAEFTAAPAARSVRWDSGARPGKWTTIGCGLGLIILIGLLFAGSNLLRKAVWATFAGTSRQLVANLPGDLPPGERMRLQRNLDRFEVQVKRRTDDYADLGEFHTLARELLEDRRLTRGEVNDLNEFLESKLPPSSRDVPYSMP
jgi:hypothetical protein